jgi:isopenicillin N synthase-like dioxygenase
MPLSAVEPISYALARTDPDQFAQTLGRSFRKIGFAAICDHPLDQAVIGRAHDRAKAFFALPAEVKAKYFIPGGGGQRGYTPFATENAKGQQQADLKEFWHVGRDLPAGHRYGSVMPANVDVEEIADWHAASYGLFEALDEMGAVLLRALTKDLGLSEDWFEDKVGEGNSILRLLHYPPQQTPPAEGSVRAGAHEDINVITLLLGAEEAGLQVKAKSGGWLPINPPAGSLVINIGDMLQRLTNHVYPSTTHRVVNPAPERSRFPRYSMPFFLHFQPDVMIRTLPQCVTEDNPDRYPMPISANDYLLERLREIGLIKPAS